MRRHLVPYLAFLASFLVFAWLLQGAQEGARLAASAVLALLVWGAVANRTQT